MDDPLIWWRAIHFGATAMLGGVVFFLAYVAAPAFAGAGKEGSLAIRMRRHLGVLAWVSLMLLVASGAAWVVRLAQQLSEGTLSAVLWDGIVWIVLTKTSFGTVAMARLALAVVVGACLFQAARSDRPSRVVVPLATAALVGSLAFAGHAAAGAGVEGLLHLVSDIVHLVAAAAWVGALVPLAMLLYAAGGGDPVALPIARIATRRFSTLGVISVAALLVTGLVNTWVLAGSVAALVDTDYGRLLLAKIALFLLMVAIAAVNRRVLTPRLVQESDPADAVAALRKLRRNCVVEAAVGAIVLIIVAALGTLPPGAHEEGLHPVAAAALAAL